MGVVEEDISLYDIFMFLVYGVISFYVAKFFDQKLAELQISLFASSDRLVFSSDPFKFYYLFLSFFCIPYAIRKFKRGDRSQLPVSFILFVVAVSLFCNDFFQYQEVQRDAISIRDGLFSSTKQYNIKDITSVHANYKEELTDPFVIHYDLELKDGNEVSTARSIEFFEKAAQLDGFLLKQGIHIERSGIKQSDLDDLIKRYFDKVGSQTKFDIIQKLLTDKEIFKIKPLQHIRKN
ncbi:hypothetical protein HOO54_19760 [Bacillus sp. WMMC1349]|uniref:hypothetical protein n=1 Tax=Bacillus sp. WMMC1349 TaxID=2736254 RepID=UPI001553CDE6|nr:hypothetical protein [Bacillus sp. WMMC1349]NPC94396.1 hypothetical protein [Bacillus sp. WMMC1349]